MTSWNTNLLPRAFAIAFTTLSLVFGVAHAQLVGELGVLDLSANGGLNPATGLAWQPGDTYRLSFVTSQTFTATSTDINVYNSFVQGVANSSSLGLGSATWKVIGATDFVDARTNTGTNLGPVGEATFLMDGSTIFANNYADLWDGTAMEAPGLFAAPDLDEEGNFLSVSRVFTGSNNGLNTGFRQLGDVSGVTETGTNQPNNNQRWLIQFNQTQTNPSSFYALSDPLTVTALSGDFPVSILSTDFTDRSVTGNTASDIPWVTNGVADPGDLTASHPLFTTTDADDRFAVDRNLHNEGSWTVDIPLSVDPGANIELDTVSLDAFIYNNGGDLQGVQRDVDMTLALLDDMLMTLDSDTVLDIYANSGTPVQPQDVVFDLSGNTLTAGEDYFLRLTVFGQGSGNNAGIDNLNVTGVLAAVPEPASVAIWSLVGLGLAGFGYYRFRRNT